MGFFKRLFHQRRGIFWPADFFIPVLLILLLAGCGSGDYPEITVIHTNDLHGHILPARVEGWSDRTGGYATFVSWLSGVREKNRAREIPTLLLDAGDIYMGTVEGNLTRGGAVIGLMNRAGYDAMGVGNHEFDYGYFNLYQLAREADFPFLSANILLPGADESPDFIHPYLIKEYDGLKVGIIGVSTPETSVITAAGNVGKIVFHDPADSIRPYGRLLRGEGVDLLVVLSHLGLDGDRALAAAVPDIDLIVGGHSHDLLSQPEKAGPRPTLIVQAGSYGRFAGRLDLKVDTGRKRIAGHHYSIFINRQYSYPADLETNRLLNEIKNEVGDGFDQTVGIALQDITSADEEESPLGDLITDAMRKRVGAAAAFQNPYGIRGNLLQGPITRRDVYTVLPFDNSIVTLELAGGQIRELLEQSLTFKKGLLQISGLRVEYSLEAPEGNRVRSVEIDGDPLEDSTYYRVATNVFLAGGGDYFSAFAQGRSRRDSGVLLRDAVADYISLNTPLHPGFEPAGRWIRK
ncbi:MAG: 5'-nucleotidase C-terminal domain-containing protein [Candidatus Erginobacter occultus]|nr:5'-nucleotidase C-terminal domain-containing protein [Candidatus Erginobacter occultus]